MELRYFTLEEFDSPDEKGSGKEMNPRLLEIIDEIRHTMGIPFIINSGYRTFKRNKEVGGSAQSQHLRGNAVDIAVANQRIGDEIAAHFVMAVTEDCGIGRYVTRDNGAGFIHLDIRGYKARWSNQQYKDWLRKKG